MGTLNTSELKDLVSAIALTVSAAEALLDDGGVNTSDLKDLPKVLSAIKAYSAVDFKQVIPQAKDIDSAELADLAAHFKAQFHLQDAAAEAMVEQGLDMVIQAVDVIKQVWDAINGLRAMFPAKS